MNNQELSFKGINIFVGLDLHKKSWTVTIRTKAIELKTFSMNPEPKQLQQYLIRNYPDAVYYSVYEAGFTGYWVHRELVRLGIQNIIVNPADIPTKHKEKDRKKDKVDSRKMARELANGSLDANYIPTEEQEAVRALSRLRIQIMKRITQIKNRIKQFLHTRGIKISDPSEFSSWSRSYIEWIRKLELSQANDRIYLNTLIQQLENERFQLLGLMRQIRAIAKDNQTIKYLSTVKGVGLITAFTFYTEIIDIKRFQKLDNLASFIGLVPSTAASGEKDKTTGLTNRYCRYLRSLIIESAWTAVRKDPALTLTFERLTHSKPKQKCIIKIAKKLINRMRYVWINQTEYCCAVVA